MTSCTCGSERRRLDTYTGLAGPGPTLVERPEPAVLPAAEAATRRSLEISPTFSGNHWLLGRIFLERGQPDAALHEMEIESPDGGRDAGLAIAYHALGRLAESDRSLALLTAALGLVLAWAPDVTAEFNWRYQLPMVVLLPISAALAWTRLRGQPGTTATPSTD